MLAAQFYTPMASFLSEHGQEVRAVATIVATVIVAKLVDGLITRRGRKVGSVVGVGELSPVAVTRLRLIRRLVFAAVNVFGGGLALLQFPHIQPVAAGLPGSSAVPGRVVGFASRQTLANAIA